MKLEEKFGGEIMKVKRKGRSVNTVLSVDHCLSELFS